jgi:tripartite-type tricarboxylate transporter receptor subunit TctC
MTTRRRFLLTTMAAMPVASRGGAAQGYPTRPLRWTVAYAPGGGTDILARAIAGKLTERLGVPVVIDNRPGAGGNIATEQVATAEPDGHTLLMGNVGPIAVNPSLFRTMRVNPQRDLAPIILLASAPLVVLVHPSLPVQSIADLVALAKARPGQLNYASAGTGSSNHLAGALFNLLTGTDIVHVPYRGAAPAMTALVANETGLSFATLPSGLAMARGGAVRAIAVTSATRLDAVPDLPTVAEAGYPGYEVSAWYGVLAPRGTPQPVITRLNAEFSAVIADPDIRARLATEGALPATGTAEDFAAHIRGETEKWARVVAAAGMTVD